MRGFCSSRAAAVGVRLCPLPKRIRNLPFVAALLAVLSVVPYAEGQTPKKPVIEDRDLITKDDLKLKITYYKSNAGEDAPVVILLHGKKGSRQQWKDVASDLQQKGDFAVVAVDLRARRRRAEVLFGRRSVGGFPGPAGAAGRRLRRSLPAPTRS